ncbi:MAG: 3-oxoacyl-ACP reductase FabG [Cyanobacteria bacterium RI_101]|nr:3-oxoacyl-ACP reductase FabG [Cyanobacteria bacterium RI_101]
MQGKKVLITGGAGGLGLGVTPLVLAQGAQVAIPYRREDRLAPLKARLSPEDFPKIQFVKTDLTQESAVAQLIQDLGRVDVLIHLTGGFNMGPTPEFSLGDWRALFTLNLETTFLLCKYCLPGMLANNYGRIVTVGSKGAREPGAGLAGYCAAKAGVVALTQAIAAETKGTNVTANTVLPSVIDTPSNRESMGAGDWVSAESLGQVICFLASEAAGDLRGAAIPVYGNL